MIIYIDGSIGVGKTTLINQLKSTTFDIPHIIVEEPVDEWINFTIKDENGNNKGDSLFELFYKDKTKYGFMFQMMALQSRISNLIKVQSENEGKLLICERSFMTDYQIFAKQMHAEGHISDMEMAVYLKWYNYIIDHVKPSVDGIIYLRAQPETCVERVNKRARVGESVIDLDYLTKIHKAHESWLMPRSDVLVVDASDVPNMNQIITYIQSKIKEHTGPSVHN